jgi:cbb3-type cytochrome oxidase cytochrome c subunit
MNSHLEGNNTTYSKHLGFALMLSFRLLVLSIAGVIHAIIPLVFQKTVTSGVKDLDNLLEEEIGNYGGTK